jgi:hypothetical protein
MPWSGCGTTNEFIELLNFGPGPMNIGCYIVTNGKYSVTIPPNTMIQPGEFFVLSGQDILASGCGNIDSAVHVQLNWNTCNCTNTAIPTTGDGFLQDGGGANEKIILLDPNLNILDAVSRDAPSSSASITTSTVAGACGSKTFDLDAMSISYETLGMATGKSNSFARRVDGDCEWIKTPQQSAHATNNKSGNTASVSYNFTALSASECTGSGGSISITVSGTNVASLFPMNYTLAYDHDSNYVFDLSDVYTYGTDNSSPNIDINNLPYGHYRITVASALGCNLKTYEFLIFNCYGVVLPLKLLSFKHVATKEEQYWFECQVANTDNLKSLVLEGSDDNVFKPLSSLNDAASFNTSPISIKAPFSSYRYYRLRMTDKKDEVSYSKIISLKTLPTYAATRIWPNPSNDKINFSLKADRDNIYHYSIYNLSGGLVKNGNLPVKKGNDDIFLSLSGLKAGMYQIILFSPGSQQPITFRFVKQ